MRREKAEKRETNGGNYYYHRYSLISQPERAFSQAGPIKHDDRMDTRVHYREIVSRLKRGLIRSAFNYFHGIFKQDYADLWRDITCRRLCT